MSLLLEALKKASEDKQRQVKQKPTDAGNHSTSVQTPDQSPARNSEQDGGQLFDLLQGNSDGAEDENLENLSGQLKGVEEKVSSAEPSPSFSLSLLDDAEDSSAATEPSTEAESLVAETELSFELELLEEEPEVSHDVSEDRASSETNSADLSGLSLVEDDEYPSSGGEVADSGPEFEASLDEVEVLATELVVETEQTDLAQPFDADESSPENLESEPDVSQDDTKTDQSEDRLADDMQFVANPDEGSQESVEEKIPDVTPAKEEALAISPELSPESRKVSVPTEKPVQDKPAGPVSAPVSPLEAISADRQSVKQDAAPDMVLDALKRQKRRRRVLVLLLIWVVGLLAGGWGYLMFLEQQEDNTRALARYRLPQNPVSGKPETKLETPTQLQQSLSDPAAVSALEEQLALLGGVVDSISDPIESAAESDPAAAVANAISEALVEPVSEATASIVETEEEIVEEEAVIDVQEAESAVTIKRRSVEKSILTDSQTLGIARRQTETREMAAFTAFQQGNYIRARQLYQKALAENALSRDAVMGLAALAAVERDYTQAANYYRQLLDYDPSDRAAFEGLIGLPEQGVDIVDMESRLRTYLKHDPNSARAYSKLGQILARQKRWYDAQQSFFNAYRLDSSNAAYALNVAIALDHLRKYTPAKQYYERVIQMSGNQPDAQSLNLVSVRKRLTALSQLEK